MRVAAARIWEKEKQQRYIFSAESMRCALRVRCYTLQKCMHKKKKMWAGGNYIYILILSMGWAQACFLQGVKVSYATGVRGTAGPCEVVASRKFK